MRSKTGAVTFFALLGLVLLSSISSHAQGKSQAKAAPKAAPAAATTVTATVAAPEKEPAPFSISLGFARTRSLYDFKDGSLSESNDFEFAPSYTWSKGRTMLALSYSQDLRATDSNNASDISDLTVAHSFKGWDLSKIKLSPGLSVTIPQSKVSREVTNLEGAVSLRLGASIKKEYLISGLSLSAGLSVGRSFHRYDTNIAGQLNNQHSSSQSIGVGYAIGIFSLDLGLNHMNSWNYNGTQKEAFAHSQEVSVSLGDHYGLSLGHTNSGSVFQANGYGSNYKLIDDNNSLVYAKVGMQY